MATVEDLHRRGEHGGAEGRRGPEVELHDPQRLYELWERHQWRAHAIDLGRDRRDWAALGDDRRDHLVWTLASFFIGEERVATQFAGLLMAYADESEESFLATQQVDEARHMQFFDRFHREVVGLEEGDFAGRLGRVREQLGPAFTKVFDESLAEAGRRLVEAPSDLGAKVDFVTTYHLVIEGMLALPAQRCTSDYLEQAGILPGLREGFEHLGRDEHRHLAYGTWFLARTAGRDEALARRVRGKLRELLPFAARALAPPGAEAAARWAAFGYRSQEVAAFAFRALERRLGAIGLPLEPLAA